MESEIPQVVVGADRATLSVVVAATDTAEALGSGDVPVLATPRLIAWFEWAARLALAPGLEPGQTTVGTAISVEHLAPTVVASRVVVVAVIGARDGRRVSFDVEAQEDGGRIIARGTHERVVVDRVRFIQRAAGDA